MTNMDTVGLNLVRTVDRVSAAHITTEYRAGLSTGLLARLEYSGSGDAQRVPMESADEAAMPDEGGRMLRYRIEDLDDGLYVAESVSSTGAAQTTCFELVNAEVRRIFESERRALQELRRRER